jgi:hypothetical protein
MKKIIFISTCALVASCGMDKHLIQKSDVCITNATETQVFFLASDRGRFVAQSWREGVYGPALVQVVDSTEFLALARRAKQVENN